MPDRTPSAPQNWSSAFAQLPPEMPPADGWSRIAATLAQRGVLPTPGESSAAEPVRSHPLRNGSAQLEPRRAAANARPRQRWMMAAMLAAALPLGLWLSLRNHDSDPTGVGAEAVAHSSAAPTAKPATAKPAADAGLDPRHGATVPATRIVDASTLKASSREVPTMATKPVRAPSPATDRIASTPVPRRSQTPPTRSAAHDAGAATDPASTQVAATTTPATAPATLETASIAATALASADGEARLLRELGELQAESAQLEALVALTRDEQVGSASATVMSSELDERVRLIDATLIAGSLPAAQRLSLWQQRVGALRTLAGVESTQRWFAARGERYDDALVRVD